MPPGIPSDIKPEVDQILEAILYLYTESRRVTKEVARRADLTGPQLTVLKVLEGLGDLSLSELSELVSTADIPPGTYDASYDWTDSTGTATQAGRLGSVTVSGDSTVNFALP